MKIAQVRRTGTGAATALGERQLCLGWTALKNAEEPFASAGPVLPQLTDTGGLSQKLLEVWWVQTHTCTPPTLPGTPGAHRPALVHGGGGAPARSCLRTPPREGTVHLPRRCPHRDRGQLQIPTAKGNSP